MKKLVFASCNVHKLLEIQFLTNVIPYEIISLNELGFDERIPEDGNTLAENASQKSHFIYDRFGLNCFADDTGLEVDVLQGDPGVYSARYAGDSCTYEENVEKLLREMKGQSHRQACFKTVISLILNKKEYRFEGRVNGQIIEKGRGAGGFGYDPVFLPDGYTQTFAEMPLKFKSKISHRSQAVEKLVNFLKKQI